VRGPESLQRELAISVGLLAACLVRVAQVNRNCGQAIGTGRTPIAGTHSSPIVPKWQYGKNTDKTRQSPSKVHRSRRKVPVRGDGTPAMPRGHKNVQRLQDSRGRGPGVIAHARKIFIPTKPSAGHEKCNRSGRKAPRPMRRNPAPSGADKSTNVTNQSEEDAGAGVAAPATKL
jgi:hypothetical protein